ncbi:MAG: hypothetical protein JWO05_3893 [Gemmatimonadetes bacterium]|nr:hypothetical protein [Gemmatimonadota bacterium]
MTVPLGRATTTPGLEPSPSRIDTFSLRMPQLHGRQRNVRVYVPPGYDCDENLAWPVLVMQDGQSLFTAGPFGDWRLGQTMDQLVESGRSSGAVIVGVDNSEHRWDEYGPWANSHMMDWMIPSWANATQGGEAAAYLSFIVDTLLPGVASRYRISTARAHTGIGGSSMGGLFALYAGLTRPDVFSKVLAMSTAVWFAESGGPWLSKNRLLALIERRVPPNDVHFYLDVGANERSRLAEPNVCSADGTALTYPQVYVEGTERVVSALRERGVPDAHLRLVIDPAGIHHETAWARRFEGAVEWLFP